MDMNGSPRPMDSRLDSDAAGERRHFLPRPFPGPGPFPGGGLPIVMRARRALSGAIPAAFLAISLPGAVLAMGPAAASDGQVSCPLPDELAAVRGHVLLRLTADETGRILWAKSVHSTIEPAKTGKKVVDALSRCLKQKPFPHARIYGGGPVRQEFLLAFHYFAPVEAGAERVTLSGGRSVPAAWLEEMREGKIELAESLLQASKTRRVDGAGWSLRTDVAPEVARDIESGLTFAARAFDAAFPGAPPAPDSTPVAIFVFSDDDKLNQVAAFDNLSRATSLAGEYSSADRMIYMSAGLSQPPAVVAGNIAHEATHHFVAQRLYRGDGRPPFWVTEGIAVLIECLDQSSPEGIDLSRFQRGKLFKGPWRWKAPAEGYIDALDDAVRRHEEFPLEKLLLSGRPTRADLAYAASWLLVHYLMNADEGKHRAAFTAWIGGSAGGRDIDTLTEALGMSFEDLDQAVRAHLEEIH